MPWLSQATDRFVPCLPRSTGAAPGYLTPARSLGDRSVDRQIVQVQADHLVVAGQRGPQHLLTDPGGGPVVESAANGAIRAARGGDTFVAAAVHQRGEHMVEHDPVGDPATVTSPGVGGRTRAGLTRSGWRTRPT